MPTPQEIVVATLTENGATAPEVDTDTLAERILGALHGAAPATEPDADTE